MEGYAPEIIDESEQGPSYNGYCFLFFMPNCKGLSGQKNFVRLWLKQRNPGLDTKIKLYARSFLIYGSIIFIDCESEWKLTRLRSAHQGVGLQIKIQFGAYIILEIAQLSQ